MELEEWLSSISKIRQNSYEVDSSQLSGSSAEINKSYIDSDISSDNTYINIPKASQVKKIILLGWPAILFNPLAINELSI